MIERRPLTAGEWRSIREDCRAALVALHRVGDALLVTLPVRVHDQWAKLRHVVEFESMKLSDLATDDGHPAFHIDQGVPRHGPGAWKLDWPKRAGNLKRSLTREEWGVVGGEVKACRASLMAVGLALQVAFHKPRCRPWFSSIDRVDRLKSRLDDEVCRQHPDWSEFGRVFYGAAPEENPDFAASVDLGGVARVVSIDRAMGAGSALGISDAPHGGGSPRSPHRREKPQSVIPENLAEANARRNKCRAGLIGLEVIIDGEMGRQVIAETIWDANSQLIVVLATSRRRVMASDCTLVSKWPVVCCRPGRRKSGVDGPARSRNTGTPP